MNDKEHIDEYASMTTDNLFNCNKKDKAHIGDTASIAAPCVLLSDLNQRMNQIMEDQQKRMNQIMEDQQKQMNQMMEAMQASMQASIKAIVNDAMSELRVSLLSVYPISENLNNYNKKDKDQIDESASMTASCVLLSGNQNASIAPHKRRDKMNKMEADKDGSNAGDTVLDAELLKLLAYGAKAKIKDTHNVEPAGPPRTGIG